MAPQELGVFFIGNSYTTSGGGQTRWLGELFAERGMRLRTGMRILGGETLPGHLDINHGQMPQWRERELLSLLRRAGRSEDQIQTRLTEERRPYVKAKGWLEAALSQQRPWDCLVLQLGREREDPRGFGLPQALEEYGRTVHTTHSRTDLVLCVTWAESESPSRQARIDASARQLAQRYGLQLAPAGTALQRAHAARPDLQIFASDADWHPGADGAYLMACVLFAAITRTNPELLPGPTQPAAASAALPAPGHDLGPRRTEATTSYLRGIAWTTYLESQRMTPRLSDPHRSRFLPSEDSQ